MSLLLLLLLSMLLTLNNLMYTLRAYIINHSITLLNRSTCHCHIVKTSKDIVSNMLKQLVVVALSLKMSFMKRIETT